MIIAGPETESESLGRQNVISVIREEAGSVGQGAKVFIRYQSDSHAEVVRRRGLGRTLTEGLHRPR